MKITQGTPKVEISTTKRKITAHAGAVLVRATAEAIGLGPAIDAHLRLKVRDRGLSEAESILGMAEALAAGAKCLDDLQVARADRVQEEGTGRLLALRAGVKRAGKCYLVVGVEPYPLAIGFRLCTDQDSDAQKRTPPAAVHHGGKKAYAAYLE